MGQYIFMPKLDMSMEKGMIVEWLVQEGDVIQKGDYIVEVETGKVSIQIDNTSVEGTVLKIYYELEDEVDVYKPIMYVGKPGEEPPTAEEAESFISDQQFAFNDDEQNNNDKIVYDYDLIVIGGGPGGYTCAIKAAQLGKKALIIEKDEIGGVCLNRGCIPTKSFIKNAQVLQTIKNAKEMGIFIEKFHADWSKVIERKNDVVKTMRRGIDVLLKQNNIKILHGEGEIVSSNTVRVGEQIITGKFIVIATGSRPKEHDFNHNDALSILNSEEVLNLANLPNSVVIYGAGVIGIEMAYVFNEYGVHVDLIDKHNRILPHADKDISRILYRSLKSSGIDIHLEESIVDIYNDSIKLSDGTELATEMVVIANKREAVIPKSYIELVDMFSGFIKVDEQMKTAIPDVYAIGDCTGKMFTAHKAIREGVVVAENLFGKKSKIDYATIPTCLFSYPEAAWVGMSEEEARAKKIPVKVSKTRFASIGKALAEGESQGLVKVIADSRWDEILGVHIVGANATDIIAQAAIAMTSELCSSDIANTVFAHPTFSEAFMDACGGLN